MHKRNVQIHRTSNIISQKVMRNIFMSKEMYCHVVLNLLQITIINLSNNYAHR